MSGRGYAAPQPRRAPAVVHHTTAPLQDPNKRRFLLEQLNDRFTRQEAILLGAGIGFSESTVKRILKRMNGVEINKISRGCYEKTDSKTL